MGIRISGIDYMASGTINDAKLATTSILPDFLNGFVSTDLTTKCDPFRILCTIESVNI